MSEPKKEEKKEKKEKKKRKIVIKKKETKEENKDIFLSKSILKKEDGTSYFEDLKSIIPFQKVNFFKRSVCRIDVENFHMIPVICLLVDIVQANYNKIVTGIFANLYEGTDYCPYHADSYGTDVITASFGGKRDFYTKHNKSKEVTKYLLEDGDILFFNQEFNSNNKHSIPKRLRNKEERISIVFFVN